MKTYKMGNFNMTNAADPMTVLIAANKRNVQMISQAGDFTNAKLLEEKPNPFAMEPAALAVFMLVCDELEQLKAELEQVKASLAALEAGDEKDEDREIDHGVDGESD